MGRKMTPGEHRREDIKDLCLVTAVGGIALAVGAGFVDVAFDSQALTAAEIIGASVFGLSAVGFVALHRAATRSRNSGDSST